jgi:tetratricopeptide (TPR) repeat protein/DNA-directed RNA polymerase subunit M/transcription elongation factor TFIIS
VPVERAMSIKFSCPHCSKALNVKDHLAGKKAQCPACKKVLVIPSAVKPSVVKPGSREVEALAAEAFAESERQAAEQPDAKMEFACPMCDEKISVNVALAGKQAPCPECRRIIKVPLLKKQEAKDWRKLDPRAAASGRLQDVQGMEGTWGTENVGKVSQQALVEAKVIKLAGDRLSWQSWVKRSLAVGGVAAFLLIGALIVWRITSANRRDAAFNQAMAAVNESPSKLSAAQLILAHRLAGDYYLKLNKPVEAQAEFQTARALLRELSNSPVEHDLATLALATDQVGLGGDKLEVDRTQRLSWKDTQKQLQQTVQVLQTPEGRRTALQALARLLIARGQEQGQFGAALAGLFPEDKSELLSIVGLEMLRAKKTSEAEALAASAQQGIQPVSAPTAPAGLAPNGKKQPSVVPAVSPSLVALLFGVGQASKARALAPEAKAPVEARALFQVGLSIGLALDGKFPQALAAVKELPSPAYKALALTGLAETAFEAGQKEEARGALDEAAKLVDAEKGKEMSSWVLWKLVTLAGKLGAAETGQTIARNIADPALRQQAAIDLLPGSTTPEQLETALGSAVDKNSAFYARALSEVCRKQASQGDSSGLSKGISTLEPEKLRPFANLGLALGLQEHNQ